MVHLHTAKLHNCVSVVDGGWSEWKPGPCSKTCGRGIQNYTRVCNNPKPSCGGVECTGASSYTTLCNNSCCPGKFLANK